MSNIDQSRVAGDAGTNGAPAKQSGITIRVKTDKWIFCFGDRNRREPTFSLSLADRPFAPTANPNKALSFPHRAEGRMSFVTVVSRIR